MYCRFYDKCSDVKSSAINEISFRQSKMATHDNSK